jgi:hypothetical protein
MKQVFYHQAGQKPLLLEVVKDNKDGTFDLARTPDGPAIITGITIGDQAGDGCATPVDADKPKGKKKAAGKKEEESSPEPEKEEASDEAKDEESPPFTPDGNPPPDE